MSSLDIRCLSGQDIERWIPDLARLRMTVFRDYPYLYDGTLAYEEEYLRTYTASTDSIVILALDSGKVVGASTGIPMTHETTEFKAPFVAAGINPEQLFYCGESILLKSHRGQGTYATFFTEREAQAKRLGLTQSTFCCVQRPDNHPLKPADYQPLDNIWRKFGYTPCPDLRTTYDWQDIDQSQETAHEMMFWMKSLNQG